MAVLVTGGAGYIGSHMVWELLDRDEEVVVVDNLSSGFEWAVAPEARLCRGDVADKGLICRIVEEHGVDAIIHFAGSVVVPESVARPLSYYENNTCRSRALIEAAVESGVKSFIFSSTAAVYAGGGAAPLDEEAVVAPQTPYGMSKLMVEQILRDVSVAHPLSFAALRYFNVAGADPKGRTGQSTAGATHLIKVVSEATLGKRSHVDIYGTDYDTPDGTGVRDFIHVSDLVGAHYLALQRLRAGGGNLVANCGYGHGYSVREVIASARKVSGREVPVREAPRRPGDLASVIADAGRARKELKWAPSFDDLDGIVETSLAWEDRLTRKNSAA
ncbi:UDP-glucose 4-epimerase GalE [Nitratireductor mangrovi]|uniref:UDP-glucose 4-epimerase n=1 Tax=Nitratireductor mangrovi TaxID=2599600 RepID=A0A5B8L5A0_9HYPH|nr:UDP-glucose 4-epimerase GalE [Nitratireductor mangrovi]QDZ02952.1 UDP-glucose 4-epimerase GalE [Nitratireductor mangrovi]